MTTDIEFGTGESSSWVRPAVRRQNRWFAFGVATLFVVLSLGNFYAGREGDAMRGGIDDGTVGNDTLDDKMQDFMKHKGHGDSKEWEDGGHATNGVPSWLHDHQNSTTNQGDANGETKVNDAGAAEQDQQEHSEEIEETESDQSGNDSQQDVVSLWQSASVSLGDGVMYEVVDQLSHDANAFTQGLTYAEGVLYESTGLYGQSSVRKINPETGDAELIVSLNDSQYFGEGMVYLDGKLIQITWKSGTGFVYNASDLRQTPESFEYETTNGEGWGITHNPDKNELIVSDGTEYLHFWDPSDLGHTLRTVEVARQNGRPAKNMNELEFWRGRVLANVWFQDVLLVIHPDSGVVEKEYDFSSLWPKSDRPRGTNVFNGISVSSDPNILYVTGKMWNRMFRIKLLP